MTLPISEEQYQQIRQAVLERQAAYSALDVLAESHYEADRRFETVDAFLAYLDGLDGSTT